MMNREFCTITLRSDQLCGAETRWTKTARRSQPPGTSAGCSPITVRRKADRHQNPGIIEGYFPRCRPLL